MGHKLWAMVQKEYGKPMKLNSSFRCHEHNKAIGAKSSSSHCLGVAVDIDCDFSRQRFDLIRHLLKHVTRIGIGEGFIHADNDHAKSGNVIWTYYWWCYPNSNVQVVNPEPSSAIPNWDKFCLSASIAVPVNMWSTNTTCRSPIILSVAIIRLSPTSWGKTDDQKVDIPGIANLVDELLTCQLPGYSGPTSAGYRTRTKSWIC